MIKSILFGVLLFMSFHVFAQTNQDKSIISTKELETKQPDTPKKLPDDMTHYFDYNEKKYMYRVEKDALNPTHYNLTIKIFIADEDFGTWQNIYNSYFTFDDKHHHQHKIHLHLAEKKDSYQWKPKRDAYLEGLFDSQRKKVAFSGFQAMKPLLLNMPPNGRDIVSLTAETFEAEANVKQTIEYFITHFKNIVEGK